MLQNFEEITSDLTDYEIEVVMPMLGLGLTKYVGKANAISNKKICNSVNEKGILKNYKLQPIRVRKLIGALRLLGDPMYICSGAGGYYIAETTQEMDECIKSLEQRVAQQQRVIDAMIWQRKQAQS